LLMRMGAGVVLGAGKVVGTAVTGWLYFTSTVLVLLTDVGTLSIIVLVSFGLCGSSLTVLSICIVFSTCW